MNLHDWIQTTDGQKYCHSSDTWWKKFLHMSSEEFEQFKLDIARCFENAANGGKIKLR